MTRLATFVISVVVGGALVLAHGDNEHLRGVVTQISASSVTVQTADKATKTLTITAKTTFEQSGKTAHLADLKVGERVVIDVPEKSSEALLIKFGPAPKAPAKKVS